MHWPPAAADPTFRAKEDKTMNAYEIGILGTGRMGVRLARLFADNGHGVLLGSRRPARAAQIARGLARPRIAGGSYEEAAGAAVVIPAMFLRDGMLDTLEPLRAQLSGKIVVDITNPFNAAYDDFILPWDTSGAEHFQHRFPRARLVGAYKNVWWEVFDQPQFDGAPSDVYVVGDDAEAKRRFLALAEGSPFRYLDAGPLINARFVERMTLFSAQLGQSLGYFPRMNWRLLGEPWRPGQADELRDLIAV
jgi:predicted dinucleotide-binding enzyme